MKKIKVIDLFSGVGGFSLGFHEFEEFEIVFANDIWDDAAETYTFNLPETVFFKEDIQKINSDSLLKYGFKNIDVIIGGPPCQGFSVCGTREPCDDRNFLVMEFARIVDILKPKIFIMENVKGFLSMKNPKGIYFKDELIKKLKNIYNIEINILKAHLFGVPQKRERVFIVGIRKDIKIPVSKIWPLPKYSETDTGIPLFAEKPITVGEAIIDLPNADSPFGELEYGSTLNRFTKKIRKDAKKIFNHELPKHSKIVIERMKFVPPGGNWKNIPKDIRPGGNHSNLYKRLDLNSPSVTIKHPIKSMIIHPIYDRCLSVREAARLQSFPDNFIFKGSKTSQYQQIANAVPPLLSEAIAESVLNILKNLKNRSLANV